MASSGAFEGDEEEAGGGQGKQEVAEAAPAPVGHARCLLARGRRQGEAPGGLGRLLAGPACYGWAAQGKPQVSTGRHCFLILFSNFSDIV